jgi:hypothetical protein
MLLPLLTSLFLAVPLSAQVLDSNGISLQDKVEDMERRMLQINGLDLAVRSCDTFLLDKNPLGHISSAEWVRLVFHDAVTANVAAGTGYD